jgi:membrane dipeptidase
VVLAHTDFVADVADRRTRGERAVLARRHLPVLRRAGVDAVCEHVGGDLPYFSRFPFRSAYPVEPLLSALRGLEAMHAEAEESGGTLRIVRTVADIQRARRPGQVGLVLCLEGGMPLGDDLALLRVFHRLGIRIVGLTWNHRNQLGDGVGERQPSGLSDLGRAAVRAMNRLGILIDVSHLAEPGCWDVLETSRDPVIASHSNCEALVPHPRNLKDDLIRGIAGRGGLIGIHALGTFVRKRGRARLDDLLDHLDHLREVAGPGHVAIGPDLLERWPARMLRELWRGTPFGRTRFLYPTGFRSVADLPNVTAGLLRRGWAEAEVAGLLGGNLLRLFGRVWGR